ncbi:MetQ/NlpA family ABC transporter substrate-binding protein [Microbacterium binotii]|uniref:MetQ/NlpA family ABC transporter substrate-binding protein n=1 Tax=Microbacterium binotii TaxID=462710 RepID=A0ABP6BR54_9MICO
MSEKPSESPDLRTALDASRKRRRTVWLSVAAVAVVAVIVGVVAIVANLTRSEEPAAAAAEERLSLRISVSEDSDFQSAIADIAAEKGLDVTWVNVDDWVLPNTELAAGTVDGNAFQHILYLSNFNAQNNEDLTPVFSTVITQWGIFSATLGDTDEIPDGGRIAIPDDPSNGGRALGILASAGLIELSKDAGDFPSVDDVTANPKNLQFVPIAATTIPQQFDDPSLSAVVVGLSYFDPSQGITADKALYLDDSLDEKNLPYINVVASRADNADDPAWKILQEAYADPRAAEALEKEDKGATVLVQIPVDTLRTKLADLEKSAAANG